MPCHTNLASYRDTVMLQPQNIPLDESNIYSILIQRISPHFVFQCVISIFRSWHAITVHHIRLNLHKSAKGGSTSDIY